jgi:hypothetical protein
LFEQGDRHVFDFELLVLVTARDILGFDNRFPSAIGKLTGVSGLHVLNARCLQKVLGR